MIFFFVMAEQERAIIDQTVAIFVGIEVKTPTVKVTKTSNGFELFQFPCWRFFSSRISFVALPDGLRSPPSQRSTALFDTPMRMANLAWVSWAVVLISRISIDVNLKFYLPKNVTVRISTCINRPCASRTHLGQTLTSHYLLAETNAVTHTM